MASRPAVHATGSLREEKKQRARAEILRAAADLIGKHGYEHAKMRDIAAAADVSYQTLYNYFPNKALIVLALLTRDLDIDGAIEAKRQTHKDSLMELLYALVKIRFDTVAHRDRELWREVVREYMKRDGFQAILEQADSKVHERIGTILSDFQHNHMLDAYVDTHVMARTLEALIDNAFLQYIMVPTQPKVELLAAVRDQLRLVVTPYMNAT